MLQICVCVCKLQMCWIYWKAMKRDDLEHKDEAHPSFSLFPSLQSVTSVPSVLHAALNSGKQVSYSCVLNWPSGSVACTLLTDCHTVALSQYEMLHSAWPTCSFHCWKMCVFDLLALLFKKKKKRSNPLLMCAVVQPDICIRMLFVNFSSAFNTVFPMALIGRLHTLGWSTVFCNWMLKFELLHHKQTPVWIVVAYPLL